MNAVILGGILLGDTFRLNEWLASKGESVAFSDHYNGEAVDLLHLDTNIPIIENKKFPVPRVRFSWDDVHNYVREIKNNKRFKNRFVEKSYENIFYPSIEDIHHPLKPFLYSSFSSFRIMFKIPEKFICIQPQTHFGFKDIPGLFQIRHFPLSVINIGSKQDTHRIVNSLIFNGCKLRETAYIISKATLMVGVDSWATQFAAQIGVPSIKCHFGNFEFDHRNVRDCGGADLFMPHKRQISETINAALEIIESGSSDISSLTRDTR